MMEEFMHCLVDFFCFNEAATTGVYTDGLTLALHDALPIALLKIIAGLRPATAGEVRVDGRPVTGPGPERAVVYQDFALMPWATVLRNVAFGLELRGVARSKREAVAEQIGRAHV